MLVGCPKCKTKFRIDDDRVGEEGIKLRCSKCLTIFRVLRSPRQNPAACPAPVPPPEPARARVYIGHESPGFCEAVKGVLSAEPYAVTAFHDGEALMEAVKRDRPEAVLLDVALPKKFGFEVCEEIKNDPALTSVKVILIAAIYDKTRYKRMPTTLYSADDYIEKHHIPDDLVAKINRLVAAQVTVPPGEGTKEQAGVSSVTPGETSEDIARMDAARVELKRDEVAATTPAPAARELPESHVKARRLARIIASDIALYNQLKVEEGVRNGTFFELLKSDIREGNALYVERVPEEVRNSTRYLDEAFEELISKVRKELKLP